MTTELLYFTTVIPNFNHLLLHHKLWCFFTVILLYVKQKTIKNEKNYAAFLLSF